MLASDETELAAIVLEEEVTTTASTEEEETNELMDSVISDRQAKLPDFKIKIVLSSPEVFPTCTTLSDTGSTL